MSEVLTVKGFVASEVELKMTESGIPMAHFRLGATERKFDKVSNEWVDGETNWFSVSAFRALAQNIAASVNKGERILVVGRLKLRQWTSKEGKRGTTAQIDADSVGHDLMWGTAKYQRLVSTTISNATSAIEDTASRTADEQPDGGAAQQVGVEQQVGVKQQAHIKRHSDADAQTTTSNSPSNAARDLEPAPF